jgi:hypothetical protein
LTRAPYAAAPGPGRLLAIPTTAPAITLPAGDGVTFPLTGDRRTTTPTGRAILADAARAVSPALAARIEATADWRSDYPALVHELTALSGTSSEAALAIAHAGLASMRERMVLERDGNELPLDAGLEGGAPQHYATEVIEGAGPRVTELRVPYRGGELRGDALRRQLDRWVEAGVIEPSACVAIRRVMEHPEWLRLTGRRIAVVGAASEVGPLEPLTMWGADVIALDVPRADVWERIAQIAGRGAGTVTLPADPAGVRGADLLRTLPEVHAFLGEAADDAALVLGMYAYADGAEHVRVTAAFDALAAGLLATRPGTALAFLATPTDAFVVPAEVVAAARAAWDGRGARRLVQAPLRALSGGRLFTPAYAGSDPVADILVEQQGPNYALAKRLQRWRGVTAAAEGHLVSFNVAPSAWTRSVTRNRVLAAAYAGAHRFGIEIFDADTCRVLMAALLVHDLHQQPDAERHPEALFSEGAVHGGLWRSAYEPRSVLGLAALAGLGARRT